MKNKLFLIAIVCTGLIVSCDRPPVFIPVRGTISGTIFDNNGFPLSGVRIEANFDAPENNFGSTPPATVTALTNAEGRYELREVWDRVDLTINQEGFQPVFERVELKLSNSNREIDFTLVGSPTIQSIELSKTLLAANEPDTLTVRIETRDLFNSNFGSSTGHLLLKNDTGGTALILTASEAGQSNRRLLFEATLTSGQVPAGTYRIVAEITDPDGNFHQALATEEIRVE